MSGGTGGHAPARVAVVGPDDPRRRALTASLAAAPDLEVVAWAEDAGLLLLLGTRLDVCLVTAAPDRMVAARLLDRGTGVVLPDAGEDPVAAVREELSRRRRAPTPPEPAPPPRRPRLAPRQRDVLVAYVTGNDLLPTVARQLGMERETLKTHLRRIRAKYRAVGRPAPTRRDLYIRAMEDGLVPPPTGTAPWPGGS